MIRITRGLCAVAAAIFLPVVLSLILTGCKAAVIYELKLDAIRVMDRDANEVNKSLWIYDFKGKLIRSVFTPGKLDPNVAGSSWVSLNDPDFKSIPTEYISDPSCFALQIKLNPNRFMTPPDAIFDLVVNFGETPPSMENTLDKVVKSEDGAYELRLWLRWRNVGKKDAISPTADDV